LAVEAIIRDFLCGLIRRLPEHLLAPALIAMADHGDFAADCRRLFHEHLHGSLTPETMAATLQCSPSSLTRRCRQVFGLPPAKAFLRYRLDQAPALLADGRAVKEVAATLGFQDQGHFSRAFRGRFGRPPSAVRPRS
jgi:AraC-like DNA-binding protein